MQALAVQEVNSRKWDRMAVSNESLIELGDSVISGTIKDFGGGGVFFEADVGYLSYGGFTQDALDELIVGEELIVQVFGQRIVSTVAWIGHSATHSATGCGLSFQNPIF